jgi:hypothetical protein
MPAPKSLQHKKKILASSKGILFIPVIFLRGYFKVCSTSPVKKKQTKAKAVLSGSESDVFL